MVGLDVRLPEIASVEVFKRLETERAVKLKPVKHLIDLLCLSRIKHNVLFQRISLSCFCLCRDHREQREVF